MTSSYRDKREALLERAASIEREAKLLRKLADELYPPSDDEATARQIEEDDEALLRIMLCVYRVVQQNPGIETPKLVAALGFPDTYPAPGANYFTMQLLSNLENYGWVSVDRTEKTFRWMALPLPPDVTPLQ